jgi:cell division protein FtsN
MASKKRKRAEPAPGWAWMLFGLSIGLAVALFVYLKNGPLEIPDLPRQTAALTDSTNPPVPEPAVPEPQPPAPAEDSSAETVVETDETQLSFYNDLPESTVDVNESEFDFASELRSPQDVIIQAGSFPSTEGADSRRASLAFLGFESSIEQATVNGKTYHRVIIGPLSDPGEVNRTLRRLRSERIETVLRVATN